MLILINLTVALLIELGRKVHGDKRQQCDDGGGDKQLVYRQVALGNLRDIIAQSLRLGAGDELEVAVDDDLIHLFAERTADGSASSGPAIIGKNTKNMMRMPSN